MVAGRARTLAAVGAAVLLRESQLTPVRLAREIEQLRADPSALPAMAAAARAAGEIHRSGRLALLIEEVAGSGRR